MKRISPRLITHTSGIFDRLREAKDVLICYIDLRSIVAFRADIEKVAITVKCDNSFCNIIKAARVKPLVAYEKINMHIFVNLNLLRYVSYIRLIVHI